MRLRLTDKETLDICRNNERLFNRDLDIKPHREPLENATFANRAEETGIEKSLEKQ